LSGRNGREAASRGRWQDTIVNKVHKENSSACGETDTRDDMNIQDTSGR
jgi:hypothetical protein